MSSHTVLYRNQSTVDGRIFNDIQVGELPLPVLSIDGTLIGQVVDATVHDDRVDVVCDWDIQDVRVGEPDWKVWCLMAELKALDCEVSEFEHPAGRVYRIRIDGTLAGLRVGSHAQWPWVTS